MTGRTRLSSAVGVPVEIELRAASLTALSLCRDLAVVLDPELGWQATTKGKLFAFLARTDSPPSKGGSDYAGRLYYNYANQL
jgi:hypothetical protein